MKTTASSWPSRCARSASPMRSCWNWTQHRGDRGRTPGHGQQRGPAAAGAAADQLIREAPNSARPSTPAASPPKMRLVTFGIVPTAPETGYGYIEASEPFSLGDPSCDQALRGKPDKARAEQFLATGRFWNSGMFLFRASAAGGTGALAPEVVSCCRAALGRTRPSGVPSAGAGGLRQVPQRGH